MHKLDVLNSGGFFHCISFGFSFSKRKWGNKDGKCVIPRKWKCIWEAAWEANEHVNQSVYGKFSFQNTTKKGSIPQEGRQQEEDKTEGHNVLEKRFETREIIQKQFWDEFFVTFSFHVDVWCRLNKQIRVKRPWNILSIFLPFIHEKFSNWCFPWNVKELGKHELILKDEMPKWVLIIIPCISQLQLFRGCKSLFKRNLLRSIVRQWKQPRACYLSSRVPELIAVSLKRPKWAKNSSAERGNIP